MAVPIYDTNVQNGTLCGKDTNIATLKLNQGLRFGNNTLSFTNQSCM
jgi:hypothetical protein